MSYAWGMYGPNSTKVQETQKGDDAGWFGSLRNWALGDPSKGYKTAAEGAGKAAAGYSGLAGDVNTRAQQIGAQYYDYGADINSRAQGIYDSGSRNTFNTDYYQGMNRPGAAETAFDTYGSQFLNGGGYEMKDAYARYGDWMRGETNSQKTYDDARAALTDPGRGQQAYDAAKKTLSAPTQSANYWSQQQSNFNSPWAAEDNYRKLSDAYGSDRQMLSMKLNDLDRELRGSGSAGTYATQMQRDVSGKQDQWARDKAMANAELGSRGALADYENEAAQAMRGSSQSSQYQQRTGNQLEGPSGIEQWANQALATGSNAYLDRQQQQSIDKLNQEMARRGGFKSGGAGVQMGNLIAATEAEKSKQMADWLTQADQAKLQRLGLGSEMASKASAEGMQRGTALQGLGQSLSQEQLGRQNARLGAMSSEGNLWNASQGLLNDANKTAAQMEMERLALRERAATDENAGRIASMAGETSAASAADSTRNARLATGANIAQGADSTTLANLSAMMSGGNAVDANTRANWQAIGQMGNQSDQLDLQKFNQQFQMASGLSNDQMKRLDAYMTSAQGAQAAKEGRLGKVLQAQFGLDQAQANTLTQTLGMGLQGWGNANLTGLGMYGDAMGNSYNALANQAGLRGQGQTASQGANMQLVGMGLNAMTGGGWSALGGLFGGGGGGGGGYAPPGMQRSAPTQGGYGYYSDPNNPNGVLYPTW